MGENDAQFKFRYEEYTILSRVLRDSINRRTGELRIANDYRFGEILMGTKEEIIKKIIEEKDVLKKVYKNMKNNDYKQPIIPVGVMPKKFWEIQRMRDLQGAIFRYVEAGINPEPEWIEEYQKLSEKYPEFVNKFEK